MDSKTSSKSLLQLKVNRFENYQPLNERTNDLRLPLSFSRRCGCCCFFVHFVKSSTIKIGTHTRIYAAPLPVVV